MAYIDRPLDNSIGTSMTLREGCDLINDNFEVLAADKLKLDGIESGAQVNTVTSVAGRTGDVVLTKSDVGLNNVDNTADTDKSVAFAQNAASSETLEGSSLSDVQTFVTSRTGDTSTLTTTATELSSAVNELDAEKFDKTGGTISGDVTVSGNLTVDSIKLSGGDIDEGTISWNTDEQTADITLGNSVLQLGQEFLVNVRNNTVSSIPNGTPLMFTGTLGASGRILVTPMDGTNRENYKRIVGFATENIPAGADGKATALGKIRDINTTGTPYGETWLEGDVIYISPTIVGGLTKVEPTSTGLDMAVAIVVNVHATVGTLYLRVLPIDRNRISPAVQEALDGKLDLVGGVIPSSQLPSATETEKGAVEKATNAEALAGTADKFPDAAGVHAAFNQYGYGALRDGSALGKDFNLFTTPGFYQLSSGASEEFLNAPAGATPSRGHLLVFGNMAPYGAQVFFDRSNNNAYFRNCNGTFQPWVELHHTGNGATNAEALTGLITDKWVSPANVKHVIENSSVGTAAQADKLTTPRTINGTAFDGTAAITTTKWGTARNLNGVSVDGSADKVIEPYIERDDSSNLPRYITFVDSVIAGYQRLNMDNTLTYNPATNVLGATATAANALTPGRLINGTNFDGSANITTANWGTARTITIAGSAKSVNGSGNVTWSLTDLDLNGTLSTSGIQYLPSGLIIQWGFKSIPSADTNTTLTFNSAFPNACIGFCIDSYTSSGSLSKPTYRLGSLSAGSVIVRRDGGAGGSGTWGGDWIAIGY